MRQQDGQCLNAIEKHKKKLLWEGWNSDLELLAEVS